MSPIDFEAFAGAGFHADVGTSVFSIGAECVQVLLQNGDAAAETEWAESLGDYGGRGMRVVFQQFADSRFEGVQFAGAIAASDGGAGVSIYFARVRRPMWRCRAILRSGQCSAQCRR